MRESQRLRDKLNGQGKSDQGLQSPFLPNLTLPQLGVLFVALRRTGFPKPWKRLKHASKTQLVSLLTGITKRRLRGDKEKYPPVIIEHGAAEFDHSENCWRVSQLGTSELSLFKIPLPDGEATERWEHSGRRFFFGFIRIDRGYNEEKAVEAFRKEFRNRWPKTRGGGSAKCRERLNQLAVIRIWKHERDQWKRLKLVAKFCKYSGCIREAEAYKEACKQGHGDQPMSNASKVEMSSARAEARTFFQSLFPGEEPLSY
jgi:hypothetical protein